MFWLTRPPYLRWAVATAIVLVALWTEFRPPSTGPHPFALVDLPAGATVSAVDIEMREVPLGLLAPVDLPVTLRRDVIAGQPLLSEPSSVTSSAPDGWWSVSMDLPVGVSKGTPIRLALTDAVVDGIVIDEFEGSFGDHAGLVAVPPDTTGAVAAALRDGSVVVFVGR